MVGNAHLRSAVQGELLRILRPRPDHDLDCRSRNHARVVVGIGVRHAHHKQKGHRRSHGREDGCGAQPAPQGKDSPHQEGADGYTTSGPKKDSHGSEFVRRAPSMAEVGQTLDQGASLRCDSIRRHATGQVKIVSDVRVAGRQFPRAQVVQDGATQVIVLEVSVAEVEVESRVTVSPVDQGLILLGSFGVLSAFVSLVGPGHQVRSRRFLRRCIADDENRRDSKRDQHD